MNICATIETLFVTSLLDTCLGETAALVFCVNFPDTLTLLKVCFALSRDICALVHTDDVAFNAKAPATPVGQA